MNEPQWRVLTKRGPLEEGMANHSSIPATRTPWTVWKGKKIWHQKMSPPGWKVSNMLLGKRGGQLLIAPEGMKRLGQNGNNAQLWMHLVVKLKSDIVKNNTLWEPGMWGPWIKVNCMWSRRRCPGEGNGSPLQYTGLENPTNRGAW